MGEYSFVQALNRALREEMRRDERVYVVGEGVVTLGRAGQRPKITQGLFDEFGPARVRESPLSETAIAGSSAGAALGGLRPVACFNMLDFMLPALDEILAKAGMWRYEHGGSDGMSVPVVFEAYFGGGASYSAEHSRSVLVWFMHAPGLKVAVPTTPYDGYGLMKTAIRDNNPVVFLEPKLCFRRAMSSTIPEEEFTIPFGIADIKHKGDDITVVATGWMVHVALEVAAELEKEGIGLEVIDPRTLVPLDIDTIVASVRKTGKAIVVEEDNLRCGITAEIAAQIYERAFDSLEAPVERVAAEDVPVPTCPVLEREVLPQPKDITAAVRRLLGH